MVHAKVFQVQCLRVVAETQNGMKCLNYGMTEMITFDCDCGEKLRSCDNEISCLLKSKRVSKSFGAVVCSNIASLLDADVN